MFRRPFYETTIFIRYCFSYGGGEVVWVNNPETEKTVPYVQCGCGFYRVTLEEIQRWEIVFSELLRKIGEAMGFSPPFREVSPDLVWQLGRHKRRDFYYIRCADFDVRRTLRDIFAPLSTAVLIIPTIADIDFIDCQTNQCFSVESIGTLDDSLCLNIDMTSIDTELEPTGSEPKRQHAKRGNRAANIEKLIAEMKEYLRASKDHYYATKNLLPRPNQAVLAKWVGIRQDDVSRCLNDPDATYLKLLWKNAENVSFILDYL